MSDNDWLSLARESFDASSTYLDANWRKRWERNIALFQSRHPDGSKYNTPAFRSKSRYFRPKTKSVVRKNEAAAAAAFFANIDVVSIEPQDDANPMQRASAEVMNELVNYRLENSIPWYLTLLGGLQEAQVMGVVASYQYWMYKEKVTKRVVPLTDALGDPVRDEKGQPLGEEVEGVKVLADRPCIELMPLENFRFDPGACWTDIVGSSPYIIRCVPMYVDAVKQQMKEADPKTGAPKWKKYDDGEIRAAMVEYDSIRTQREGHGQDPKVENNAALTAFEIVWCHENFVRIDGEEYVYWTLGTQKMLTDPQPLEERYFQGERPFVVGCAVFETHRTVPESIVGIGSELQRELNDTANQRRDNVSLVLNKRWVVKRGAQVDTEALMRNVAGGAITANDVDKDIRELNWPDVTASAYAEQDRLNVDFDELTGNFSQSSVSTNRSLNETVGGMRMLGGGAQQLTEYLIRTFVETWVEPVLKQLVRLEQAYETDQVILSLVGSRAKLPQKYGIDQVTDELLNQSLTTRVNVGLGATDPQAKLQKFMLALKTYAETMQLLPDADPPAIRRELFALVGYKDGDRFFKQEDNPVNAQMMQQLQELQQALGQLQQELAAKDLALKDKTEQNHLKALEIQSRNQIDMIEAETKRMAVVKPDAPQMVEDPDADLNRQILMEEAKARLKVWADSQTKGDEEGKELLKLAAAVIEKSLTKPEPSDVKPEGAAETGQGLAELMSAIDGLAKLIQAPRKKIAIRNEAGELIGAREEIEMN